jgi:hypothetical protein
MTSSSTDSPLTLCVGSDLDDDGDRSALVGPVYVDLMFVGSARLDVSAFARASCAFRKRSAAKRSSNVRLAEDDVVGGGGAGADCGGGVHDENDDDRFSVVSVGVMGTDRLRSCVRSSCMSSSSLASMPLRITSKSLRPCSACYTKRI